jgi:tRNA threonylcarbamoyladenosine biosynthesis protein TsaE
LQLGKRYKILLDEQNLLGKSYWNINEKEKMFHRRLIFEKSCLILQKRNSRQLSFTNNVERNFNFQQNPNQTLKSFIRKVITNSFEETEEFGAEFAQFLGPKHGDFVTLKGSIGIGKSVFARGFVRKVVNDPDLIVLSPTYLLEQEYSSRDGFITLHHFDLYRFQPEMTLIDAQALDWENSVQKDICLVEWPERIKNDRLLPFISYEVDMSLLHDHGDREDGNVPRVITVNKLIRPEKS